MIGITLWALAGGLVNRWRGHASRFKKYFPRPWGQILFASPYAFLAWEYMGLTAVRFIHEPLPPLVVWPIYVGLVLLVWAATTLGALTGHGGGHDVGHDTDERDDETLEFIVKPLRGRIPEYLYDVLLLSVTGLAVSLWAGIATLNPFLAASGALKGLGYALGERIYHYSPKEHREIRTDVGVLTETYQGITYLPRHFDRPAELGEFFAGVFMWGSIPLAVWAWAKMLGAC